MKQTTTPNAGSATGIDLAYDHDPIAQAIFEACHNTNKSMVADLTFDDYLVMAAAARRATPQHSVTEQVSPDEQASLLQEVADVLAEQNWRGDLVERLRAALAIPASNALPENWQVREAVNRKRATVTSLISDAAVGEVMSAVRSLMASTAAEAQAMPDAELSRLTGAFAVEADADSDAELRAGGPKRLIAFDYYKRGHLAGRLACTAASEQTKMDAHTTSYNQGYRAGIQMGKALAADEAASEQQADHLNRAAQRVAIAANGYPLRPEDFDDVAASEQQAGADELDPAAVTAAVAAWRDSTNHPASGNLDRIDIGRAISAYLAALTHRATTAAPGALTDAQIIAALHSEAIDTYPSKYGFDAVQVSATSVPSLRKVFERLAAAPDVATTAADGSIDGQLTGAPSAVKKAADQQGDTASECVYVSLQADSLDDWERYVFETCSKAQNIYDLHIRIGDQEWKGSLREVMAALQGAAQAQAGDALDAARYRWLRNYQGAFNRIWVNWLNCCDLNEKLDAAIDAAMDAPATTGGSNV